MEQDFQDLNKPSLEERSRKKRSRILLILLLVLALAAVATVAGLLHGAAHDLTVRREHALAEVACETLSAEEGRPLHKGD